MTDNHHASVRVPISVYVMWHPDFHDGSVLASAIHDWLGPSHPDLRQVGMVPRVYFRSEDWRAEYALSGDVVPREVHEPDALARADSLAGARIRRPISWSGADINLLVPIVDPHMLTDRSWQRDLRQWAAGHRQGAPIHLAPVQLVPSLESLGSDLSALRPIQVDAGARALDGESRSARLARRIVRLRRAVMQRVLQVLQPASSRDPAWSARPLRRIFLSHEQDVLAHGIVEALRDAGRDYGRIETFCDDSGQGSGWGGRASVHPSASIAEEGFVAVLSDRYARHAETRMELSAARTPRADVSGGPDATVWMVRPTVAVSSLSSQWSRIPDDLATVPVLRYAEGREQEVFDGLLREAMVQAYQLAWARKVARLWPGHPDAATHTHAHIVTWTPDRPTLTALRAEARRRSDWPTAPTERVLVIYPGFGFFPGEEARLERDFGAEAKLRSYAEVLSPPAPTTFTGTRIWFSSEEAPEEEQAARGYDTGTFLREHDVRTLLHHQTVPNLSIRGSGHVDAAILRIIRRVVPGADLALAGPLRGGNATTFDQAVDLLSDRRLLSSRPAGHLPLLVVVPWPHYGARSAELRTRVAHQRSRSAHVCRFYDIPSTEPPTSKARDADGAVPSTADHSAWRSATAFTRMRALLARRTDITISAGGRLTGYDGLMPGVFEEVLASVQAAVDQADAPGGPRPGRRLGPGSLIRRLQELTPEQVSVVLVGELGGAARLVVQAIEAEPGSPVPTLLTLAGQLDHPGNADGIVRLVAERAATDRFVRRAYHMLAAVIEALRRIARLPPFTPLAALGLTVGEWRRLMVTSTVAELGSLMAKLHPGPGAVRRRVPDTDPHALPIRLQRALETTLADGIPSDEAFDEHFGGAREADDHALANTLAEARAGMCSVRDLAEALHHHLGVQNPRLWELLATSRPGGAESVRTAFDAHHIPEGFLRTAQHTDGATKGRLAVHLVWNPDDPASSQASEALTHHLSTLGDGRAAPGRSPAVRHWPYTTWPPASPDFGAHEDNLVVLLWRLDQPVFASEAFRESDWVHGLLRHKPRVVQAVHVPADQLEPPPAGFLSEGYRELLWTSASRTTEAAASGPVGTLEDVLAAALWATTLTLRPRTSIQTPAPEDVRLAFALDSRPTDRVHAADPTLFLRRRCLVRQSPEHPCAPTPRSAAPERRSPPLFDVEVHDEDTCAHRASERPRVVVGRRSDLAADTHLAGLGRLTTFVDRTRPAELLLASHLVAARQRWLHDHLSRAHTSFPDWSPMAAPGLLALCAHANRSERPVLVPEPGPTAVDRAELAQLSLSVDVHSPTSAHGAVLAGRTVTIVCVPPDSDTARALGLPSGGTDRILRVLRHVFEAAGAAVQVCSTLADLTALSAGPTAQGAVLVGIPEATDPADDWLVALRVLSAQHALPIWPLGVLGGVFGGAHAGVELLWPDIWTTLGAHNGLGPRWTEALAAATDVWDAAERVLQGAQRL